MHPRLWRSAMRAPSAATRAATPTPKPTATSTHARPGQPCASPWPTLRRCRPTPNRLQRYKTARHCRYSRHCRHRRHRRPSRPQTPQTQQHTASIAQRLQPRPTPSSGLVRRGTGPVPRQSRRLLAMALLVATAPEPTAAVSQHRHGRQAISLRPPHGARACRPRRLYHAHGGALAATPVSQPPRPAGVSKLSTAARPEHVISPPACMHQT